MWSIRDAFENDFCPVGDELLGAMYRANAHGLPQLIASLAPDVRAKLALFCYRRSHLHPLALVVAANCAERDLVEIGGRVGSTLFALSRGTSQPHAAPGSLGQRKSITLSTRPLSTLVPLDDQTDDDEAALVSA
jgi:hypothetical protein